MTRGIEIAPFFKNVVFYTTIFGLLFGVPVVYFFSSMARIRESESRVADEKIKRLSLEKDSALTGLQLLQAQIEPHFLFNTLSNVIVLLDEDPARAKDMLVDINTYLKIAMQRTRQDMITLKQELELVRRYLNIFKMRLGERFSFEIHDAAPEDLPFPPLIIQPLVENAVKYGIAPEIDVYDKIQNLNRFMDSHNPPEQLRIIKVKTGADIRFIPVSEILFFKAEEKYTLVQTAQSEHLINKTIKELEKSLDPGQFWRTHRSAIVNIEKIQSVKRSLTNQQIITFRATDKTIPVSKPYEYLFKQM